MAMTIKRVRSPHCLLLKGFSEKQYFKILRIFKREAKFHESWNGFMLPCNVQVIETLQDRFRKIEIHPDLIRDFKAAEREFDETKEIADRIRKIKRMPNQEIDFYKFKVKPWNNQLIGFRLIINCSGVMLLWDMRTGKTYAFASAFEFLKQQGIVKRGLVVCPKDIRINWVQECSDFTDLKCLILGTGTKQQMVALQRDDQITVVDGPYVRRVPGHADLYITNTDSLRNQELVKAFKEFNFDMLCVDEIHLFKHRTSARTQGMLELRRWIPRRVGLTGTIITKSPLDAYQQMKIINNYIFPEDEDGFGAQYCIFKTIGGHQIYDRPRRENQKELWRRINKFSHKVRIEECHDMPDRLYTTGKVELTKEQKKAHRELCEELATEIDGQIIEATILTKTMKMVQITSGFMYLPDGTRYLFPNNPKLKKLREILDQVIRKGRKIVVWGFHHETMDMIRNMLIKEGINYALVSGVDGTMTDRERHEQKYKFQNDDNCSVMVANPTMLSMGLSLSQAKYMVFYENRHLLAEREQAEARNYDNKAKQLHGGKVVVYDLLAMSSIDMPVRKCLRERKNFLKFINSKTLRQIAKGLRR